MSQVLKDVYETKYGKTDFSSDKLSVKNLKELAKVCTSMNLPVTYRHLHSVLKGHQKPKPGLEDTLQIYANELDGQSYWQARMRDETIRVFNSTEAHRAWLDPNSKILKCARPECDVKFIKTWPGMKYCPRHRSK